MKEDEWTLTDLRAEQAFLKRIARRLTRDEWEAEDLIQETWVSALEQPPDPERSPRPWFSKVLGNHLLQRVRSSERRRAREERVASWTRGEIGAAAEDAAKAEVAAILWSAIDEVREPYRQALLLRYREELEASVIADRLGVPLETVRSRLRRGLTILRERLGKERSPEEWTAGLILFAGKPRAGVLWSTTATYVALGTAAALTVLIVTLFTGAAPDDDLAVARSASPSEPGAALEAVSTPVSTRDTLSREAQGAPLAVPVTTAADGTVTLRGSVEGMDNAPAAGVLVRAIEGPYPNVRTGDELVVLARTHTDEQGNFELKEVPIESGLLANSPDGDAFARYGQPRGVRCNDYLWDARIARPASDYLHEGSRPLLRLREACELAVHVRGPDGRPLPEVELVIKGSGYTFRRRRTDVEGLATFGPFVSARSLVLCARLDGYATQFHGPFRMAPGLDVYEIELGHANTIDGWVVDPAGRPVEGARVRAVVEEAAGTPAQQATDLFPIELQHELGGPLAVSDALGVFVLEGVGSGSVLVQAHRRGALVAELPAHGGDAGLVLRQGGGERPVQLVGIVRDIVTGKEIPGALVWAERRRGELDERVGGTGQRFEGSSFRLEASLTGEWSILVTAEGYAPFGTAPRFCDRGEHHFDVWLHPARDVLLRVEDPAGPLPGSWARATRRTSPPDTKGTEVDFAGRNAVADESGVLLLKDVPSSSFRVILHVRSFVRPFLFDLPPGDFSESPYIHRLDVDCSSERTPISWVLLDNDSKEVIPEDDFPLFDLDVFDAYGVRVLNFHFANRPPAEQKQYRVRVRVPVESGCRVRIEESPIPDPFWWLGPGPLFVNGGQDILPDLPLPAGRLRAVVTATGFEPLETWFEVEAEPSERKRLRLSLSRTPEDLGDDR
jgi:RNA polymerase sigma-70 factor (ECF subfamily)